MTASHLIQPLAGMTILAQAASPAMPPDMSAWVRDLTATSLLAVVCWVLWKAYQRKDTQVSEVQQKLVEMAAKVTETTTAAMDAVKEQRGATQEMTGELRNLGQNISTLSQKLDGLRCLADDRR